jgi:hypothetical protein
MYGQLRQHLGVVLRGLAHQKEYEGIDGHRPCARTDIYTAEVLGIAVDRVYEGQECNQYCEELYGAEKEFYWSAFLGQGIVYADGGFG